MNVIILHGLYMHGIVMQPLAQRMEKLGYDTHVLTYNTVAIDAEALFAKIERALSDCQPNILIGHSLGGLMIKRYLEAHRPSNQLVTHAIAIGTPFQGASIISPLQQFGMSAMFGNAIEFGLDPQQEFQEDAQPTPRKNTWWVEQKLGCIAGTMPIGFRPFLVRGIREESDGTVTVAETKIEGMTDHVLSKNSHTSLIYSEEVVRQIHHFIQHDRFS